MSLMNTLSGKGEAISSFQADGSGNAPASWRLPHSAARAEEKDEVKQRELLNSMESMQLMLQKAQEDEETARLHAQVLADRLSQGSRMKTKERAVTRKAEDERAAGGIRFFRNGCGNSKDCWSCQTSTVTMLLRKKSSLTSFCSSEKSAVPSAIRPPFSPPGVLKPR